MRVTVISLDNWGYNKFIARELQKRGVRARHLDFNKFKYEYPSKFHKFLNFFTKTFFNFNFKRFHLNQVLLKLLDNQEKQDCILVIKGDNLSVSTIKQMRKHTDNLITFFNDSIDRYPRMKKIYPYFDKVYSFDSKDTTDFNFDFISNYIYFDLDRECKGDTLYDVFNISSLDKRSKILPRFASYFKKHQINHKLIAYCDSSENTFNGYNIELTNKTYPLKHILNNFVIKSDVLLDIQRPKQTGLSFRIFEGIGLEKKIITTNKDIVNYEFYNSNNIAIVDDNNINIPENFFTTPYQKIDPSIIDKYHISSWVDQVFNLKNVCKTD